MSPISRRSFVATAAAAATTHPVSAVAQSPPSRKDTLVVVQEYGPNSLDMQGIGASQPVNGVSVNCYDRLLRFKPIPLPGGAGGTFSMTELEGELAESWQMASDGMSCTFKLRPDATFHSGRAVSAKDVKWSLDRAVSIGGFATTQMNAGSLEKPDQFVVVDDKTFRVDFVRKDKMTLPDLAVTIPFVFDSELALKNAGEDPWAKEFLKNNVAGSGAFKVESWKPGTETIYTRFDSWKGGKLPEIRRIITRDIASPSTRRALIERGDADMSYGLPPKDFKDLLDAGKVRVVGVPVPNALWYVALNSAVGPFTNVKIRQAVAYAMPYEKIMQAALFGRGVAMWGGPASAQTTVWPQKFPYTTDLAKAQVLIKESGAGPFKTQLSFDAGSATIAEPLCVLIQESLAPLGIEVELQKITGANFRGEISKKTLPMVVNRFGGWLDWADYFFYWKYHGRNSIFNIPSYQNAAMDKLIDAARFASDPAEYERNVKGFVDMAFADVPFVPIAQPLHDVAMTQNIGGYQYWPCREPDFRYITKT
jgi:peptide/nickel transport system substrate-binding protein